MAARKTCLSVVVLLGVVLVAGTARAQGKPDDKAPSPEAMKQAKAHYLQGKAFQDAGAYDQAIAEYQTAYGLAPLPDLLFNLAQCGRLKGDKRTALADYKRYLAAAPDGRGAPDARKFVAILTKEIADEDSKQAAQAQAEAERKRSEAEAERARKEAETRSATSAEPKAQPPSEPGAASSPGAGAVTVTATPAPAAPEAGRSLRIAGLATAGAGVALLAGGIAFGLKARSASNDLDALGPGQAWNQDLYDSGKAAQRNMYILVGVGSAAVIGGGVMYYLGYRAAHETTVAVTPLPGGAALAFTARY